MELTGPVSLEEFPALARKISLTIFDNFRITSPVFTALFAGAAPVE